MDAALVLRFAALVKPSLGKHSVPALSTRCDLSDERATTTTAGNAAWDGMFQAFEANRVPETIKYLVYYIYVLLLSCSIILREAWRTSGKTKSVGLKKSLNIDVETFNDGIAYFTVGS